MLKLATVLNIEESDYEKYKIHFAIGVKSNNKTEPLIEFFKNTFKEWQEFQNQKNFERDYIISLIYYKEGKWLFAGIYKSNGCIKKGNKYFYDTQLVNIQRDLIGRIVVDYDKQFRQSYVLGEKYIQSFLVSEIFEKPIMIEDFPGYNKVNIAYEELKLIVDKEVDTWKNALSIMKGIYLIVDQLNGKKYVGSAYGDKAFWNRWMEYIGNGHGGNKELKKIIDAQGIQYATNFRFSILEIAGMNITDESISQREVFWKDVLKTREFGYNKN